MPSATALLAPREGRWLVLAALLHALGFLFGLTRSVEWPAQPPVLAESLGETAIVLEEPELPPGDEPGGGSPVAAPEAAERAGTEQPDSPAPGHDGSPRPAPPASEPEVLDADTEYAVIRPKPARRQILPSPAFDGASLHDGRASGAAVSRWVGPGYGARGGPGGSGDGGGKVTGAFDFGGPAGAFRAEVCFFQPKVESIAEIKNCKRAAVFYTNYFNVSPRRFERGFPGVTQRIEWFAIRFTGTFSVAQTAEYRFRLVSDDGAMLYLDDRLLIDNDGHHPPRSETRSVRLEAGTHRLFMSYFQGPREMVALQLFVTPPGGAERLFGPTI
jgi:hypothetical protein